MDIQFLASRCKKAAIGLAALSDRVKNMALGHAIIALRDHADRIYEANARDLDQAARENLEPQLMKRLKFDQVKLKEVCDGIESLIAMPDPVGRTLCARELDAGLRLYQVSRPIGVIGVIFESRPDALVQIAALCLKSGNAVLLKGGREAMNTNQILASLILEAGVEAGLPEGWLGLLETRSHVDQMLKLEKTVDLIIPRGSNAFVRYIMDHTAIPVLGHADGVCHLFVDRPADLDMAMKLCIDAKCQYPAVCNAVETILVHEAVADSFLPVLKEQLDSKGVEMVGCEKTRAVIDVPQALEKDWTAEYLDLKVSVRVVPSLEAAVDHINRYGSGHTDAIVTRDRDRALYFMDHADTADAFWNCSTRFSDGFRFGLGAEVGISTQKVHARGPVGLEGLMSYQWRLLGEGHRVADYAGQNARPFTHKPLNTGFDQE